ncbi:hypothetical protein FQN57_001873 [Myotisia sp. PD_48]|nr:hypothetical protein FQN57_001873 [Myotisia sp. PD_48]
MATTALVNHNLLNSFKSQGLIAGTLLSLTSVVIVSIIWQIVHYRCFHPLRHYPGPWLASVTRLWLAWHHIRGTELHTQWMLIKKHGPVIRITPTMLLVADSKAMPTIYHRRNTKSRFYLQNYLARSTSLLIREPEAHAAHRRLISAPYALSNIQRTEPLLDNHVLHWVSVIDERFARQEMPLDFSNWSPYLAYDTITDLAFRNPLGFIKSGSDVDGLIENFRVGLRIAGMAAHVYSVTETLLIPWLERWVITRTKQQLGLTAVIEKARSILAERSSRTMEHGQKAQKGEKTYDFFTIVSYLPMNINLACRSFMDARTPNGYHIPDDTTISEMVVILGAGSDAFGVKDTYEREILERLRDADPSQPGYSYISTLGDSFEHHGPNGRHVCLIFQVMGETLKSFGTFFEDHMIPNSVMRRFTIQLLLALDYAHDQGVIHTDIKPDNIFVQIKHPSLISERYLPNNPADPAAFDPSTDPWTIKNQLLKWDYILEGTNFLEFDIALGDWGVASWANSHLSELIQPIVLRSPEVLIGAPWGPKTDL